MNPRYSIVIVNYNSSAHVARLLQTLRLFHGRDYEVIIFDNNSQPADRRALAAFAGDTVRIIPADRNWMFSGGVNRAVAHARGDILVIANPDLRLLAWDFSALDRLYAGSPHFILGPLLLDGRGRQQASVYRAADLLAFAKQALFLDKIPLPWPWFTSFLYKPAPCDRSPVFAVTGSCLVLPRHTFDLLGGIDEHLHFFFEEIDLAYKARSRSVPVYYSNMIRARHEGQVTYRHTLGRYIYYWYCSLRYILSLHQGTPMWQIKLVGALWAVVRIAASLPAAAFSAGSRQRISGCWSILRGL